MSARAWIRHPNLPDNPPREVAASAVRVYVRSGWQEMSDDEVGAHLEKLAADRVVRTQALTPRRTDPDADTGDAAADAGVDAAAAAAVTGESPPARDRRTTTTTGPAAPAAPTGTGTTRTKDSEV